MKTIWNDPDKTELNHYIKLVGEIYEQNQFKIANKETLNLIRRKLATGLHDSYRLLELYLGTKGMKIDENTKEIIYINI